MTEDEAKAKVAKWCIDQVGYSEEPKGSNNNKYARISAVQNMLALGSSANYEPWCVIFVVAAFEECFGAEVACKMLRSSMHNVPAYVSGIVSGFQKHDTPQVGDMVAYSNFTHIGMVVSANPLKLVDGNYSDGVCYDVQYSNIIGYYTPDWYYATTEAADAAQESISNGSNTESEEFSVGDWVYCSATKDYSNMLTLKEFVRTDGPWKIIWLKNDRAVLNENMSGTHEIMTPVRTSTLTKYTGAVGTEDNTVGTEDNTVGTEVGTETTSSENTNKSASNQSETPTSSVATSYGVQGTMAEKIAILNNTASSTHTYGGRITNVQDRNK